MKDTCRCYRDKMMVMRDNPGFLAVWDTLVRRTGALQEKNFVSVEHMVLSRLLHCICVKFLDSSFNIN